MTANRLGSAASSYLRSAAHQPTHWRTWSAEAFEEARRLDRPILLDIGAVWCHWCHVMDRESYESEDIARLLNEHFIPIKVDRDERPDVDARYQKAIQAMIGQGGWPLTAFLLPDGRPFYGGTYFPPVDAHGRPSFRRVLEGVAESYANRRAEVVEGADQLRDHLAERAAPVSESTDISDDVLELAVGRMREAFDPEYGGFGRAPKFPHPAAHDFLVLRAERGDGAARDVVGHTLERMRHGGVYDQVAGGFHRYSVDRLWLVPHFEKMLYDNAGLLRNFVRAGVAFDDASFRRTAADIAAWMRDVLAQPEGGLGGSQDADVGLDDDGDFFTWTLAEFSAAIDDPVLTKLAGAHLGVSATGHMHHDPSKCVLHITADAEALAAAVKRPVEHVRADLEVALARLRAVRAKREAPFVDPIRYASWNGMAIQALLEHGSASGDADVDRLALKALDVFLSEAYDPKRGFARSPGSEVFGMLDDNAQMLDALLEAHFATGEARYLKASREVADLLITHFAHPAGGFADRASTLAPDTESVPLSQLERPIQDTPTASPNGVALRALLRLAEATGERRYHEIAEAALRGLAHEATHLSLFGGALLLAMEAIVHPPVRIEVKGDATAFRRLAREHAPAGSVLVTGGDALPADGALVCLGDRCLAPAHDAETFLARLTEARKVG